MKPNILPLNYFSLSKLKPTQLIMMPKFSSKVSCSFFNSAEDYQEGCLSLDQKFVKNPSATFPVEAQGDCMKETIQNGDILLVDQSLEARSGQIILASLYGDFTVKRLFIQGNHIILKPDNPFFKEINITEEMPFEIRGVITSIHRQLT